MSAELVQDAIVTQLSNDASVSGTFGVNILKGMGRNFNFQSEGRGIRVYLMLENVNQDQIPNVEQNAIYPFLVVVLFYEPDEAQGEVRKTQYSSMVRKALNSDPELGGAAYDSSVGDTRFYFHPAIEGAYYMAIPFTTKLREPV